MSGLLGNLLSAFPVQLSNKPELKNDTSRNKDNSTRIKRFAIFKSRPKISKHDFNRN